MEICLDFRIGTDLVQAGFSVRYFAPEAPPGSHGSAPSWRSRRRSPFHDEEFTVLWDAPEQSASLPGRTDPQGLSFGGHLLALLAAALAFLARTALLMMALAASGFCSRNRVILYTRWSITGRALLLPQLLFGLPFKLRFFQAHADDGGHAFGQFFREMDGSDSFNMPCFLA